MSNPYEVATSSVREFRKSSNLLRVSDIAGQQDRLLLWAVGELSEVLDEIEKEGTKDYNHAAYQGEMHDKLVFVISELIRINRTHVVDFGAVFSANGVGKRSDIYDKLEAQLYVLIDDKSDKAFEHFLKLFYSALKYSPGAGHLLETFIITMEKVRKNRHEKLYSTFCPILQRELNEEECLSKHAHLERMTGYLRRKHLGRDLEYADWSREYRPDIYWLMVDWIQSDWAFAQLKGICDAEKNGGVLIEAPANGVPPRTDNTIARPSNGQVLLFSRT